MTNDTDITVVLGPLTDEEKEVIKSWKDPHSDEFTRIPAGSRKTMPYPLPAHALYAQDIGEAVFLNRLLHFKMFPQGTATRVLGHTLEQTCHLLREVREHLWTLGGEVP